MIVKNGFEFTDYLDYSRHPRPCILRHDVDFSLQRAVEMARFEAGLSIEQEVRSTYFVLLNSEFYNPVSPQSRDAFAELKALNHHIGLHFDTTVYGGDLEPDVFAERVQEEAARLSRIVGTEVQSMSMHIPSQAILDADLRIPGIINTYGEPFFHGFTYLSDSELRWREDPVATVSSAPLSRLHLLTHPLWYSERVETLEEKLLALLARADHDTARRFKDEVYPQLFAVIPEEDTHVTLAL